MISLCMTPDYIRGNLGKSAHDKEIGKGILNGDGRGGDIKRRNFASVGDLRVSDFGDLRLKDHLGGGYEERVSCSRSALAKLSSYPSAAS